MFLNCHTAFSFKYGTLPIEKLFDEARRCGVHKLVLTEINNTASYIEMLRLCAERKPGSPLAGDHPHELEIAMGIEFRQEHDLLYIAIARNNNGFENINRFLSHYTRENKKLPERAPVIEDTFILYPFGENRT
jgi:DNA polymerase III alpha subunit